MSQSRRAWKDDAEGGGGERGREEDIFRVPGRRRHRNNEVTGQRRSRELHKRNPRRNNKNTAGRRGIREANPAGSEPDRHIEFRHVLPQKWRLCPKYRFQAAPVQVNKFSKESPPSGGQCFPIAKSQLRKIYSEE